MKKCEFCGEDYVKNENKYFAVQQYYNRYESKGD